ncbi:B12-binding domain-containing radical SAM protein [Thermoproteota archaeon]
MKKIKTLLINTPTRTDIPSGDFPLGIGYIAAVLNKNKLPFEVLDIDAYRYSKKEVTKRLKEMECDVIGIGGIVTSYKYTKWLIKTAKKVKPGVKVIVGGHLGTSIPDLLFKNSKVDFIVMGDGEDTIVDLIRNIDNPKHVKGICYRHGRKIIRNSPRQPIENLDSIPFPAYEMFPTEKYVSTSMLSIETNSNPRSIGIVTHRGCPFRCIFCHNPNQKIRSRSPENIIKEVKFLKNKYDINFVHFADELFVINKKWVLRLCELMKKEKIRIAWSCMCRVNLVDESLLRKMKSSGCVYVGFGIESASQKMLDAMKKDCTVEQQKNAIRVTRKLGFNTYPTFIIGTPGETEETVMESVEFCKEFGLMPEFFYMTPFPNTELYHIAMKKKLIKNEDKYIENLGECTELRVNLTDMSDKDLIALKKRAEQRIYLNFMIRHPFAIINKIFKTYKNYGFLRLFSLVKQRISVILK